MSRICSYATHCSQDAPLSAKMHLRPFRDFDPGCSTSSVSPHHLSASLSTHGTTCPSFPTASLKGKGPGPVYIPGHEPPNVGQGQEPYDPSYDSDSGSIHSHKHLGQSLADVLDDIAANSPVSLRHVRICSYKEGSADGPAVSGGVLSKCYVFHVCSRAVLEVGFVLAQWKLFGFQVSTHFLCSSPPCGQLVDCYVSRPTQKTIFLLFMFCMGVLCILLNVLELNHVGWKKVRQVVRLRERASWRSCPGKRGGYETFTPDSPSHPFSIGLKDKTSTSSLPTLDLVVGHQRDGSCVINCGKMKVHEKVGENIAEQPKRTDSHKSEKQPLKNTGEIRGSKQRSAEVWI